MPRGSGFAHTPKGSFSSGEGTLVLTPCQWDPHAHQHLQLHPHLISKEQLVWREEYHVLTCLEGISGTQLAMRPRLGLLSLVLLLFQFLFFVITQKGLKRIVQIGKNVKKPSGADLL